MNTIQKIQLRLERILNNSFHCETQFIDLFAMDNDDLKSALSRNRRSRFFIRNGQYYIPILHNYQLMGCVEILPNKKIESEKLERLIDTVKILMEDLLIMYGEADFTKQKQAYVASQVYPNVISIDRSKQRTLH